MTTNIEYAFNFTLTDTLNRVTFMLGGSDFVLCSKVRLHAANDGNIFARQAA